MKENFSVKKHYEFKRAYNKGLRKGSRFMSVNAVKTSRGYSRLGLSVSRKFGNSVQRNRFKRLVRESFREIQDDLQGNFDIIVTARFSERAAANPQRKLRAVYVPSYSEVRRDFLRILRTLGLLPYDDGTKDSRKEDIGSEQSGGER